MSFWADGSVGPMTPRAWAPPAGCHGWASLSSCPYRRGSAPSPTPFLSPPPCSGASPRALPPWPEPTASFALAALVLAPKVPCSGTPLSPEQAGSWPFYPRPTSVARPPSPLDPTHHGLLSGPGLSPRPGGEAVLRPLLQPLSLRGGRELPAWRQWEPSVPSQQVLPHGANPGPGGRWNQCTPQS